MALSPDAFLYAKSPSREMKVTFEVRFRKVEIEMSIVSGKYCLNNDKKSL